MSEPIDWKALSPQMRDTHFAGFARLVWEQLNRDGLTNIADNRLPVSKRDTINREIAQSVQKMIAQRAYDLVRHTAYHISPYHLDALEYDEIPSRIPDMTTLPD